MSYVLDALRKSEHERQMASGQTASILYPVMVEQSRMAWLWSAMLAGLAVAVMVIFLTWWLWSPAPATDLAASENRPAVAALPVDQRQESGTRTVKQAVKPAGSAVLPAKRPSVLVQKELAQKKGGITARKSDQPVPPVAPAAAEKAEPDDPLKGMPPLVISGYMHDEQIGSMAIINDKLVHEGEEIAPGLRLEKIVGDGALFDYKGHQFRR